MSRESDHQTTTASQQGNTEGDTNIASDPVTEPGESGSARVPPSGGLQAILVRTEGRDNLFEQVSSQHKPKPSQTDTETHLENIEDEETG